MAETLAIAIEGGRWELVALCLLLGMVKTLEELTPDALEALLELLGDARDHE